MSTKKVKKNDQTTEAAQNLGDKIAQLDQSVEWFYSDDFSLSEAIDRYEEAAALAKSIETDLKTLKNKISVIEKDFSED